MVSCHLSPYSSKPKEKWQEQYMLTHLALRVLPQITPHITRLDLSHNLLLSAGTVTLFTGLRSLRPRYAAAIAREGGGNVDTYGERGWSMREVNLGVNGIGDEGFEAVMRYARGDEGMREVRLQGNDIRVSGVFMVQDHSGEAGEGRGGSRG